MLSIIVAMANNQVIGKDNALPWHYPEDLRYFKEVTLNKTVIMGSKTYDSILTSLKKPLPNRHHVILTRKGENYPGVETYASVDELLKVYQTKDEEVFVIGGASVYEQFLPFVNRLYITHINQTYEGDTYFPPIDKEAFVLVSERVSGELTFSIYERREDNE